MKVCVHRAAHENPPSHNFCKIDSHFHFTEIMRSFTSRPNCFSFLFNIRQIQNVPVSNGTSTSISPFRLNAIIVIHGEISGKATKKITDIGHRHCLGVLVDVSRAAWAGRGQRMELRLRWQPVPFIYTKRTQLCCHISVWLGRGMAYACEMGIDRSSCKY